MPETLFSLLSPAERALIVRGLDILARQVGVAEGMAIAALIMRLTQGE